MLELSHVSDGVPVSNALGISECSEYILMLNGNDIGILEAFIEDSIIYIFNVELEEAFRGKNLFKSYLENTYDKIIVFWPKNQKVLSYWETIADEIYH